MADAVYNVMYKLRGWISVPDFKKEISASDVVSIALINRYDVATYPIIRIRFYADMNLIEDLNSNPDDIRISVSLDGGVYKTDKESNTTSIVSPKDSITISGIGYIENKNIPVSKLDQYKMGLRDSGDLNVDSKVPFELFVFNPDIVHNMKSRANSIYRNTTVETVCYDMLSQVGCNVHNITIDPIHNQKRYDQILIPNLTIIDAFSYLDHVYGMYPCGGMLYFDYNYDVYLMDTTAHNSTQTIPIYVHSENSDNMNESGVFYTQSGYHTQVQSSNVSVLTESDIERILNAETVADINLNSLDVHYVTLDKLIANTRYVYGEFIEQRNILHKTDKSTLSEQVAARIDEKITSVDLSCAGMDVSLFKPNSRINLVFETPIRGLNIADAYRMKYACHVFSNVSGELFSAQSTMQLCTN